MIKNFSKLLLLLLLLTPLLILILCSTEKNMMNFANIINIKWNVLSLLLLSISIAFPLLFCNIKLILAMTTNINIRAEHTTYAERQVLVGLSVPLPCDIAPLSSPTDSVTLILWYRGDDISGAPIYSVDARARNTPLESAKHFVSEQYEGRVNFDISVRPAMLTIDPIIDEDNGQYWCRVDFRWTRTTISVVSLNVIVPPKRVIITDDNGAELKSIAVFDEGSDVNLKCEAIGGNPLATISWYRNNRKLKTQTVMIRDNNTVVSSITISRLARGDINSVIKCHATNSELTKPVITSITIDINLRPLKAHIIAINRERLTVGRKVEAICHTYGSRPSAKVTWLIADRHLTQSKDIHLEGNGTKSVVNFVPTPGDNGLDLVCRAENPKLSNSDTEDRVNLNVKFMPNVTLSIGSATSSSSRSSPSSSSSQPSLASVIEGNELLLECDVRSNPKPNRIRWLFNRKELRQDIADGIIITNGTLALKNARRESEGRYQCVAYNSEGRGDSGEIFVQVFYAPQCTPGQQRIIETSLLYPTNVFCQVDANPDNVTFHWTADTVDDSRRLTISSKSVRSKLTIIPQVITDFGVYSCWAQNSVGSNKANPCVFNVTDSGQSSPKPVNDCSVANVTTSRVSIACQYLENSVNNHRLFAATPSAAHFHLEVRDSQTLQLIANQTTSDQPSFAVANLTAGTIYQFVVYVSNAFGASEEVTMIVQTVNLTQRSPQAEAYPIAPENSQHQQDHNESSHKIIVILMTLLAVVMIILAILITGIILCLINRKRKSSSGSGSGGSRKSRDHSSSNCRNKKLSQTAAKNSDDSIATSDSMNRTPDVVPCDELFFNGDSVIDGSSGVCVGDNVIIGNQLIYRDIVVNTVGCFDSGIISDDDHQQQQCRAKRCAGLMTNHVSVISSDRQCANAGQDCFISDHTIFATHEPSHTRLDTFINKYPQQQTNANNIDFEGTTNFLPLTANYPQTTPV